MLRAIFWVVPAESRVEPAIISGPESISMAISAAFAIGDAGLLTMAPVRPPSARAWVIAARVKGV